MNLIMTNGYILTKLLSIKSTETEVVKGFASFKNKTSFQEVEVVYGSEKIKSGTKVLLRADAFAQPWAKNTYHYNGLDLLMVPQNEVLGVIE